MAILLLCRFGCEMPIPAHFRSSFEGFDPLYVVGYCRESQKAHSWPETCVFAYRCCRLIKKYDLGCVCLPVCRYCPVSTEVGDRIRVQFPVRDIYLGM